MPRVTSKRNWGRFRVGICPQAPSQIRPEVHAVSDEQPPDSLAELFANRADTGSVPAPLVPAQPQFASRRAMKDAAARSKVPRASTKLSRRDQMAVRKLAATPKIGPSTSTPPRGPSGRKRQNPLKVLFVLLVISGFVGGIALPAVASSANTLQSGTATAKG